MFLFVVRVNELVPLKDKLAVLVSVMFSVMLFLTLTMSLAINNLTL